MVAFAAASAGGGGVDGCGFLLIVLDHLGDVSVAVRVGWPGFLDQQSVFSASEHLVALLFVGGCCETVRESSCLRVDYGAADTGEAVLATVHSAAVSGMGCYCAND